MKKLLVGLASTLLIIGGGCSKATPVDSKFSFEKKLTEINSKTQQESKIITTTKAADNKAEKNPVMAMYANKEIGYSFYYPSTIGLSTKDGSAKADATTNPVSIASGYEYGFEGVGPNDNTLFIAEPTTVYPESKINLLRERYFKNNKTVTVNQIALDGRSGWEIKNMNPDGLYGVYRVLFIPYGIYDFVIVQEPNDAVHSNVIQSLQFTK